VELEDEEGEVRWLHRSACARARVQGVRRERRWRRAAAAAEKRLARDDARYALIMAPVISAANCALFPSNKPPSSSSASSTAFIE
jgi:hypothetical protein